MDAFAKGPAHRVRREWSVRSQACSPTLSGTAAMQASAREVKIVDYVNFKKVKHGRRASVQEGRAAAMAIALLAAALCRAGGAAGAWSPPPDTPATAMPPPVVRVSAAGGFRFGGAPGVALRCGWTREDCRPL